MDNRPVAIYVHGLASGAAGGSCGALSELFPKFAWMATDFGEDLRANVEKLNQMVVEYNPQLLVGTSMGGMFTQQLWGVPRIIVNPSFEMSRSLLFGKMGRNKYMSKRQDGATEFRIDKAVVERFKLMEKSQFNGVNDAEKELVTALFGDKDPVVNFYPLVAELYGTERCIHFNGEHRLNDEVVKKVLIPIINKYVKDDDAQNYFY